MIKANTKVCDVRTGAVGSVRSFNKDIQKYMVLMQESGVIFLIEEKYLEVVE